ncbi:MAG: hypothetical protein ACKOCD_09510 [Nitrospiraceae bacterium]
MALTGRQKRELALIVGLSLLTMAALVAGGCFDFTLSTRSVVFFEGGCGPRLWANGLQCQRDGAWEDRQNGWAVKVGGQGHLLARVELDPESRLTRFLAGGRADRNARFSVMALGMADPSLRIRVAVSSDGRTFTTLDHQLAVDGKKVPLTSLKNGEDRLWVKLDIPGDGVVSGTSPGVLSRIQFMAAKAPLVLPNLAIAALLVLTPILAYYLRIATEGRWALVYALGVLCGLAVLVEAITQTWTRAENPIRWWELITDGEERDLYLFIPYLILLGLLGWHRWGGERPAVSAAVWSRFALAGLFVWGLGRRIVAFSHMLDQKLETDVVAYREMARTLTDPYDTAFREPLWIWITKGWLTVAGWEAPQIRALSLIFSLVVIGLAYKVFRDYTGRPMIGGLVAVLLFMNPYLIRLSVRGFREEAYTAALLVVVYFALVPTPKLSLRLQAVGLALAGAVAQLIRFNSYAFLVPLLLVWAWRKTQRRWGYVAVPALFILAVSLPHVIHNYKAYGDPLYSVNFHFTWFRNYEFVVKKGLFCEGCPTRDQYYDTPYAGPPISGFQYIFGLHSIPEIVGIMMQGYWKMFLSPSDWLEAKIGTRSVGGYGLYLLGLGLVLANRYREMVLLILCLASFLPFLATNNIEVRVAAYLAPFTTFLLAYGIWWTGSQALRLGTAIVEGDNRQTGSVNLDAAAMDRRPPNAE